MAEYLKNKPIALRHCLLYLFLQKSSVEKAFTEFCEVIGEDVIKKEELEFWFDKFKNGIFDIEKDKKPITDMKDILRSDKYALRACIFYDSLKLKHPEFEENDEFIHHPVFSVYMNFCKVIGEDVMEYREFDFWFHQKQKSYELTDMPIDIMENVVEYLGIPDRLSLERTAQSLRLFSRNQKVFHGELTFNADWDSIYIKFGARDLIRYKNDRDDCEIEFRNRKKVLRGVSCLKQALQDFKKILENPKLYLRTLAISFSYWHTDVGSIEEHIEDALKLTHLLHVQHLSLCTRSMKALLNILPSLKPGYLTTIVSDAININADEAAIKELVKMDQWKQAKCLLMSCYLFDGPLRHLYHFKEFAVFREELYIDDVREMKEILLKSLDFERCNLRFHDSDDPIAIRQVIGGPIEGSTDICHYPIPNSTEYFEIIVGSEAIKIERKKK